MARIETWLTKATGVRVPIIQGGMMWVGRAELTAAVASDPAVTNTAVGHHLGITQVVTDGPEGTVVYHLQVDDDAVRFGAGPADPEHARFDQSWATAVGVATGTLALRAASAVSAVARARFSSRTLSGAGTRPRRCR